MSYKTERNTISAGEKLDKELQTIITAMCTRGSLIGSSIREYGSTLYVGMARKKNGRLYISLASDELKSLVIYTDKF